MNDLKEIGGFIVSADPFVQHDSSLSGNGTVNSPLGVVPGYNETLLWSGTATTSFSLSEEPSAFNQLRIKFDEMGNGNRYGYMWCNDTTRNPLGAAGLNFLTNDTSDGIHINASRFTVAGTNLTMDYCVKKWLTLSNGTQTWGSTGTLGSTKVFEIVGINRKQ